VAVFPPDFEEMSPWELILRESRLTGLSWTNETGRPHGPSPEMRGLALLSRTGAMALFAGAPQSLEEVLKSAETGRPPAFELPVQVSLRTVSRRERTESPNVAAVLRGSDPRLRDEYVVLSAHLDHLGIGEAVDGDAIYNGAYDNASGVAILLEVAKALARLPVRLRRSVLFLAFTGEEQGLNGSGFFARHPTVPIDRIVAAVNLDMFLMLHPLRDVIAFGAEHSSLGAAVEQAAGRLGIALSPDPLPEQVLFIRTDHYSFVQQGVPAIFLSGGFQTAHASDATLDRRAVTERWMQEVYHQPGDDMSQSMDFGAGAQFAKLSFLVTSLIAQEDRAPSWNPGDFFGEKFRRKPASPRR
jgi:hypothetical protein